MRPWQSVTVAVLILASYYLLENHVAPKIFAPDCGKIKGEDLRDKCYYQIAWQLKDARQCEKITREKSLDECLLALGSGLNDTSICDRISSSNQRIDCLWSISQKIDPKTCERLPDEKERDGCYQYLGIKTGDVEICRRITNSTNADSCYYWTAINTKNKSICGRVQDPRLNSDCKKDITA